MTSVPKGLFVADLDIGVSTRKSHICIYLYIILQGTVWADLERARCKNLTRLRESWQAVTKKRLHIHSMQLYACTYLVGTKWKPTKTEPTLLQFG